MVEIVQERNNCHAASLRGTARHKVGCRQTRRAGISRGWHGLKIKTAECAACHRAALFFAGESAAYQPPARAEEEQTERANIEYASLADLQKCGT